MIFLKWHLGLGDAIICNGLVREIAKSDDVMLPCYEHNLPTLRFMFRDLINVSIVPVKDEVDMHSKAEENTALEDEVLALGWYSELSFDKTKWDQELYRHACVPWECRWSSFKVDKGADDVVQTGEFGFVHMDEARAMRIKPALLPKIQYATPGKAESIFEFRPLIEYATEIHMIDSAFLCLADSLQLSAKRKVFHKYAREGGKSLHPTLSPGWEIIE